MELWCLVELRSIAPYIKDRIDKCLCAVSPIVFGLIQGDTSSLFAVNSASLYTIRWAAAKQEGLEFSASKGVLRVALICSYHRIVLEGRIA
jgi:hypothetical protein